MIFDQPGTHHPRPKRRVVEIIPQADSRWEAFVAAHPFGSIFQHPAWLQVLEQTYQYAPIFLASEDETGRLQGVFPLCQTHGLLTGRGLCSLPRTPVAGPLAVDKETYAALLAAGIERARRQRGWSLHIKAPAAVLTQCADELMERVWETTYMLELPRKFGELRFGTGRNHARIKWSVNKAQRLGVVVRPATTEADLRAWYQLYLLTMRWHSVPPRPYRFFRACWQHLQPRGLMQLLLAEHQSSHSAKLLAGSLFFRFGSSVYYAFNGWNRDTLALRANDALQWHAIHDAHADGFRFYDFGVVRHDNQGLAEFKAKWGAEARQVHRYIYPAPRNSALATGGQTGRHHQLARTLWRRFPLRLTALVGNFVFSYL